MTSHDYVGPVESVDPVTQDEEEKARIREAAAEREVELENERIDALAKRRAATDLPVLPSGVTDMSAPQPEDTIAHDMLMRAGHRERAAAMKEMSDAILDPGTPAPVEPGVVKDEQPNVEAEAKEG